MVLAVRGEQVLEQRVEADRQEVRLARELARAECGDRRLDDRAELDVVLEARARFPQRVALLEQDLLHPSQVPAVRHEGDGDLDASLGPRRRGAEESLDLTAQHLVLVQEHAHAGAPERRIQLALIVQIRDLQTRVDVEEPERDARAARVLEHGRVVRDERFE